MEVSNDDLKTAAMLASPVLIILGRLWSMWEHRKTGKEVNEIRISINGVLDKRVADAKEEGRREATDEMNKK